MRYPFVYRLESMDPAVGENRVTSFDGTSIRTHDMGSGDVLLLANGYMGSFEAWRHLVAFFADRFRIVSWEYRGLYGSAKPADDSHLRVRDHARDALRVMDSLGVERFVLVGWSMGVQVGLEIYRRRPEAVRALVLMCGNYGRPFETAFNWKGSGLIVPAAARAISRLPEGFFWIGRRRDVHPGFLDWARRVGFVGHSLDDELFLELFREFGRQDVHTYTVLLRELGRHDATDLLTRVQVPTLVIAGDADHFSPRRVAEKMARRISRAELTMVPGGTHFVPLEHPELVNLRVEKFLCDHDVLDAGSRARQKPLRAVHAPHA